MPTLRLALSALLATALLASCAKHSGGQTGDEDALPSGDDFYSELAKRQGSDNYLPASGVQELTEWSERVVVGRAQALRAGRTYVVGTGAEGDNRDEMHTVVLELAVERSLKGPDDDRLFLEFIVGAAEAGAPSKLPDARVVVFAEPATDEFFTGGHIEHEGRGVPAGEPLYRLTTPQGFALFGEDGGRGNPFEPGSDIFGSSDLDDLIERIEQAVAFLDRDGGTSGAGGSAAGTGGGGSTDSDAGGCRGEHPFGPGADPAPCPASCFAVRGLPFDVAAMCVDYGSGITIGCLEGAAPPSISCVDRAADGRRFLVPSAWPFPMSTVYRPCSDSDTATVVSAPMCQ